MDEIKIGAEIVFNITGNHNIGYAKGEKYIGTVLSEDHRSRLYVRTIGMPRACIDERDVEWVIDPDGDFDMDEAIPNPMARELYKLMGRYVYTFGRSHESINGYIVYECMCTDRMGSMMDIDIYILKEEDRPYECHYLKDLLEDRVARIAKMHEDESYTYNMDDNYWCATCGSHSHKKDSKTGYCWYCDTVNWVKEDGKDVGI